MATFCRWNTTAVNHSGSPDPPSAPMSLQTIMDEALALSLYEHDCRSLQASIHQEDTDENLPLTATDEEHAETIVEDHTEYEQEDDADDFGACSTMTYSLEEASFGLNSFREHVRRQDKDMKNGLHHGRVEASRHQTHGGVLDHRTQLLLHKLINRGDLDQVHGCIQTGKEAHVFAADATDPDTFKHKQLAVKIFKTTLQSFRNRHEYVTGDRRFDLHFHKKSRMRQIKLWSEKEFKNLCRAVRCGIRSPAPVLYKDHVLLMEFIGSRNGTPAPKLKDARLTTPQLQHAYVEMLQVMRTLYHDAKLVHGDLSEYNILYHQQHCVVIDFGQAVDESHPDFLVFLRRDIENVHRFFHVRGLNDHEEQSMLSGDQAFAFIVAQTTADAHEVLATYPSLYHRLTRNA